MNEWGGIGKLERHWNRKQIWWYIHTPWQTTQWRVIDWRKW